MPDPNYVRRAGSDPALSRRRGTNVLLTHGNCRSSRGIGLADMVWAHARRSCTPRLRRTRAARARADGRVRSARPSRPHTSTSQRRAPAPEPLAAGLADERLGRLRAVVTLRYGHHRRRLRQRNSSCVRLTSVRGVEVAGLVSRSPPERLARFVREHGLGDGQGLSPASARLAPRRRRGRVLRPELHACRGDGGGGDCRRPARGSSEGSHLREAAGAQPRRSAIA